MHALDNLRGEVTDERAVTVASFLRLITVRATAPTVASRSPQARLALPHAVPKHGLRAYSASGSAPVLRATETGPLFLAQAEPR
jgi:hypothetical protein